MPPFVTLQIAGASQTLATQEALQHSASLLQASPAAPQRLKDCTPAMHTPLVSGSVRSTIVALSSSGTMHL